MSTITTSGNTISSSDSLLLTCPGTATKNMTFKLPYAAGEYYFQDNNGNYSNNFNCGTLITAGANIGGTSILGNALVVRGGNAVFDVNNNNSSGLFVNGPTYFNVGSPSGNTEQFYVQGLQGGAGGATLTVNTTTGQFVYKNSSKRYKDNFGSLPEKYNIETFMKLKPLSFTYKDDTDKKQCIGFFAEDFDELSITELVGYKNNKPDYIRYDNITIFLTKIVQEQQQQIDILKQELQALKNLITEKLA